MKKTPIAPFCIDIILPGMCLRPDITVWTGDFCRCMAWALLFPKEIRYEVYMGTTTDHYHRKKRLRKQQEKQLENIKRRLEEFAKERKNVQN